MREALRPNVNSYVVLTICGYRFGILTSMQSCTLPYVSPREIDSAGFHGGRQPQGILRLWHENPDLRDQVRIHAKKGFFHTSDTLSNVDLPWWKFEVLARLLGGKDDSGQNPILVLPSKILAFGKIIEVDGTHVIAELDCGGLGAFEDIWGRGVSSWPVRVHPQKSIWKAHHLRLCWTPENESRIRIGVGLPRSANNGMHEWSRPIYLGRGMGLGTEGGKPEWF